MKKAEIMKRLKELKRLLDMASEEYAEEWNSEERHTRHITPDEAWAIRTGYVKAEIDWILKN